MNGLQAVNCAFNCKIKKNKKCYSAECMMNADSELKERIADSGCEVYRRPEVQEVIKRHKITVT